MVEIVRHTCGPGGEQGAGGGGQRGLTLSSECIILAFSQARVKQNKGTHVYLFFYVLFRFVTFYKSRFTKSCYFLLYLKVNRL